MGERRNRTAEVRGSNPLGSTSLRSLRELQLGKPRSVMDAQFVLCRQAHQANMI
jgi:hypothetical protein